jgi:hypothetical protein
MERIKKEFVEKIVSHINRKAWWHCPPLDPEAYSKRGKFYSSSFAECEFYGRPLDTPDRVKIQNPIVGDEFSVHRDLFGKTVRIPDGHPRTIEMRLALDARMKKAALAKGYDAIVVLATHTFTKFKAEGKIPRSIELNVLKP